MFMEKQERNIIITALLALFITVLIIIFSEDAFNAALDGLKVWWEIVFPSLLPFFIITEILMGLGVVHFMGALLEPFMRPLFKVPGVGAFAMAMGLASGYPIGAKITGSLRRKNLCTKTEAERLVSFTNTADPLFMVGAVAVGMFHRADLGIIIAGTHYISSIMIGLLLRYYKGEDSEEQLPSPKYKNEKNIFSYAIIELIEARKNDGRPLGELIGDSVRESINTLLLVGGFIILFSVITKIFIITGLIETITSVLIYILEPLGFSKAMVLPLISGFFEITNGANLASQAQAPLLHQVIAANAVIAWSGLSVFAQVATMINGTDISLKPYIFSRIIQSILSGLITIILFIPYQRKIETTFRPLLNNFTLKNGLTSIFLIFISILIIMFIFSFIILILKKIKIIYFHYRS